MGVLIPLGVLTMIVLSVWFSTREKQVRIRARAELNKQLLEKFTSAQELMEFLDKESGQRFLAGLESHRRHGMKEQIIGMITGGCVTVAIGLALFWASTEIPKLQIPGAIVLAVGIGLLTAACITYGLSKKWGLMNGKNEMAGGSE